MAQQAEQAVVPTVSVEDRIGDKFDKAFFGSDEPPEQPTEGKPEGDEAQAGPEAEVTEEAQTEEGSDESVEVEFNGVKYQVPPELKDALMATSDYTKKTTETAQVRKAVDLQHKEIALFNEQRKFSESVAGDVDQLKMLDAYIDHLNKNTQWSTLETTAAFRAKMEIDRYKEQRGELAKALEGKYAQFQTKLSAEREKLRSEVGEQLSKAIPGFTEETKTALHKYVQDSGYPAAALEGMSLLDYTMAWKASQFDKLKAEAKTVVKNATTPVIKPSSRQEMPRATQEKLNTRKAIKKSKPGSSEHKAAVGDRIAQIFGG